MSAGIKIMINDDGIAELYDDRYDIVIHCESKEEQEKAYKALLSNTGKEENHCSEHSVHTKETDTMDYQNEFSEMPMTELRQVYENYTEWNKTGVIPHPSKLADIEERYSENCDGFDFIHLMERDFLRECAKRLFGKGEEK